MGSVDRACTRIASILNACMQYALFRGRATNSYPICYDHEGVEKGEPNMSARQAMKLGTTIALPSPHRLQPRLDLLVLVPAGLQPFEQALEERAGLCGVAGGGGVEGQVPESGGSVGGEGESGAEGGGGLLSSMDWFWHAPRLRPTALHRALRRHISQRSGRSAPRRRRSTGMATRRHRPQELGPICGE